MVRQEFLPQKKKYSHAQIAASHIVSEFGETSPGTFVASAHVHAKHTRGANSIKRTFATAVVQQEFKTKTRRH